jgi:type IV pilus assembly protein PilY1
MNTGLRHRAAAALTAAVLAAASVPSLAEDIDIFSRVPTSNDLPNVLLLWDASANWSSDIPVPKCYYYEDGVPTTDGPPGKEQGKKIAIEKCAIYNAIDALQPLLESDPARFNIGLMLLTEGDEKGGYPRKQFVPLTRANARAYKELIKSLDVLNDKGSKAAFTQAFYEAFLMFSRMPPYLGTTQPKHDPASVFAGRYVGAPGTGCGTNNIILISNGGPEETNTDSVALLKSVGGDTTEIKYPPGRVSNSDQNRWTDEFTRFLRTADTSPREGMQSVITHAVAVVGAPSDGLYPNYINGVATAGGGQYRSASNITELRDFLLNVFNAIEAANSAFASASLPISVNAQGTFKNQVFVGVFRPDDQARPRWMGNLKQYQVLYDPVTDSLSLGDRNGRAAISATTGFFDPNATSYWTQSSTFWVNDPKGTPKSASDAPDGEVVEKGGVAQGLRTDFASDQSGRRVLTCVDCGAGTKLGADSSTLFDTGNTSITAGMLNATGAGASIERNAIINWVRGTDNRGDELGPGDPTTVRPSIHGDVLHSRPAVVDYGGTIGTIAFYGANDGMLRAVDGNRTGSTAGRELWSFVPGELLGKFKRLRDNSPEVRFPITPDGSTAIPRDYFVDGNITVYQKLDASRATERVIIYVTMRRGGRFMYAFDVTKPSDPVMLWRTSAAKIPVLGQTWSDARLANVKGRSDPVLIMGAGYDPAAEDATTPASPTMGNAVVVLEAMTGELVKTLATDRPVPAAVALLDSDFDGYTDRGYAADTGANVYRIDFENALGEGDTGNWKIAKFASLGATGGSRKFLYVPDLVQSRTFTAVLLGSGDREKPLAPLYPPNSITNDRFYTLLDWATGKGAGVKEVVTESMLTVNGSSSVPRENAYGCYLPLDAARGEKVVTSAVSIGGYTYFSTNTPTDTYSSTACSTQLGIAKSYRLALFCGESASQEFVGGGLPPSPVIGVVEVTIPGSGSGGSGEETKQVPFIIGGFNPQNSGLQVSRPTINVDPTRRRTFWFTNKGH